MSRGDKGRGGRDAKAAGDGRRILRVEKEIREVIGNYLLRGLAGDLPGLVSVSRVIASKDLRTAKVLITLLVPAELGQPAPDENEKLKRAQDLAVDKLQARGAEIQAEVNRCLKMKHCPRIRFYYDDGFEHALRVESILRDLSLSRDGASAGGRGSVDRDESDGEK